MMMMMRARRLRRALLVLALGLPAVSLYAHDLQANRLSLVQREPNHLSLSFHLGYTEALHRALAPQLSRQAFVLAHSTLAPAELQKALALAQARFEAGTRLVMPDGSRLTLSRWNWPSAAQVQVLLQQQVMQAIAGAGEHAHEPVVEVQADALSPVPIEEVSLQLPPAFDQVLVVSWRPQQRWVKPGVPAPLIHF
jgi:hypothetical protein